MDTEHVGHEDSNGFPQGVDGFGIGFAFRFEPFGQRLPGPVTARTFETRNIHWQAPQDNINRLGNGKFWNLGDAEDMLADCFAGLFSSKPSDDNTRQMGKKLLDAMGVKVTMLK